MKDLSKELTVLFLALASATAGPNAYSAGDLPPVFVEGLHRQGSVRDGFRKISMKTLHGLNPNVEELDCVKAQVAVIQSTAADIPFDEIVISLEHRNPKSGHPEGNYAMTRSVPMERGLLEKISGSSPKIKRVLEVQAVMSYVGDHRKCRLTSSKEIKKVVDYQTGVDVTKSIDRLQRTLSRDLASGSEGQGVSSRQLKDSSAGTASGASRTTDAVQTRDSSFGSAQ